MTQNVASRFPDQTFSIHRQTRGSSGATTAIRSALTVHNLRAGPIRFHEFQAYVMDLALVSDALGTQIDGILGCPLFRNMLLRIDFPNRQVRVQQGSLVGPKRKDQFQFSGDVRPFVPVTIDGKTRPVLVDTGSRSGLSFQESVLKNLNFHDDPVVAKTSIGISGKPRTSKAARLKGQATIGPHVLDHPIITTTGNTALLGVRVLRNFTLTYDNKNALVRLERTQQTPITTDPLRSTGVLFHRGSSAWTVWHVLPYARGEAQELLPGDVVTKVANKLVEDFDCESFSQLTETHNEIEIEIVRNDKKRKLTLPVVQVVPLHHRKTPSDQAHLGPPPAPVATTSKRPTIMAQCQNPPTPSFLHTESHPSTGQKN